MAPAEGTGARFRVLSDYEARVYSSSPGTAGCHELTFKHIQQRDGRWCIMDLVGKHGRVRTVPMPTWVKVAIATAAGIAAGPVFRSVNRGGEVRETALSEKVIWQLIRPYAVAAGVPGIAPHDCRRCAECRIMPNRIT